MANTRLSEADEDVRAFDEAMLEEGASIPWTQALAGLDWHSA